MPNLVKEMGSPSTETCGHSASVVRAAVSSRCSYGKYGEQSGQKSASCERVDAQCCCRRVSEFPKYTPCFRSPPGYFITRHKSTSMNSAFLNSSLARARGWMRGHWKTPWVMIPVAAVTVILVSCSTVTRTAMAPPNIPGAHFGGSQTCAECHADLVRDFKTASPARL